MQAACRFARFSRDVLSLQKNTVLRWLIYRSELTQEVRIPVDNQSEAGRAGIRTVEGGSAPSSVVPTNRHAFPAHLSWSHA